MFEDKVCPWFPSVASSALCYWDSSKAAASALLCGCQMMAVPQCSICRVLLLFSAFLLLASLLLMSCGKAAGRGGEGVGKTRKETLPFFHSVLLVVETPVLRAAKSETWRRRGWAMGRSWSA